MHEQFASANSKIGAVNGLRGIAILMVVLHHLFAQYTGPNPLYPGEIDPDGIFAAFNANAWLGVNIFFVFIRLRLISAISPRATK
jgi:peptidoglycan/LPS O-acetylase OafA/YrhL